MKMMRYIIGWILALSLFGGQGLSAQVGEVVPGDTARMTWKARAGEDKAFEFRGNVGSAFIVDWGDGDTNVYVGRGAENLKASHMYDKAGTFDVLLYSEANLLEVVSLNLAFYAETAFGMVLEMVAVNGGAFKMGATPEQEAGTWVYPVALSSYYIGKYEVTQAQWKAVMGTTIKQQRDKVGAEKLYGVGDNYPMYYVSWEEANEFCEKLSQKTGKTYRLPTEAEWEYAARGGQNNDGTKYAGSNTIGEVAWYSGGNSGYFTHPVGLKKPNGLGLYDMSGNVAEWCSDWYGSYSSSSAVNPQGPSYGSYRVFRGGDWLDWFNGNDYYAPYCRVSYRGSAPGGPNYSIGFRVVCEP